MFLLTNENLTALFILGLVVIGYIIIKNTLSYKRIFMLVVEDTVFELYLHAYHKKQNVEKFLKIKELLTIIYETYDYKEVPILKIISDIRVRIESIDLADFTKDDKLECLKNLHYFEMTLINDLENINLDPDLQQISYEEFIGAIERIENIVRIGSGKS